jgi:hypothetical protein
LLYIPERHIMAGTWNGRAMSFMPIHIRPAWAERLTVFHAEHMAAVNSAYDRICAERMNDFVPDAWRLDLTNFSDFFQINNK